MSPDWYLVEHGKQVMRCLRALAVERGGEKAAWDVGDPWAEASEDSEHRHFGGIMGEAAGGVLFGVPIDCTRRPEGDKNAPDMILPFQPPLPVAVKTRTQVGWDFALRGMDPEEFGTGIGLLAWRVKGKPNQIIIPGYLTREQFDMHAVPKNYLRRPGQERLAVNPQHLNPVGPLLRRLNNWRALGTSLVTKGAQ